MQKSLSEENIYLLNRDEHKCISASNLKKISTVCVSKKINLVANAIYLPQTCGGSHNYIAWTPTAWGSNCGSPLTQPSSVLPSHSLFPFMSATETHQLSLDCCTHKHTLIRACSRLVTSAAEKSDAWATAYATMGVAEGGLIELGSSNYMLLRSRVCVWASERAHNYSFCSALLTPLFCNTAGYPCSPLSLIQLSYTALLTHSPGPSPMPACSFQTKQCVFTHVCVWKNTESSLTVARISLSSSHSCFNRLADILRYLVSGTLPVLRGSEPPFSGFTRCSWDWKSCAVCSTHGGLCELFTPLSKAPARGRDRGLA